MITDRISNIAEQWFLMEEALFTIYCTHKVVANTSMACPMRVGKGLIEVNPQRCDGMQDRELEERLRMELIRILLKHPYDRQPERCSAQARALGSNCVLSDSYKLATFRMERPGEFGLAGGGHYEFYARKIEAMLQWRPRTGIGNEGEGDNSSDVGSQSSGDEDDWMEDDWEDDDFLGDGSDKDGQDSNNDQDGDQQEEVPRESELSDMAANWEQDELMCAVVNESIEHTKSWGSIPGNLVQEIIASTKARIDYRQVLAGFRATVLSQARKLTRMRPNRRFGFDAMGSRYDFTTRLVIGVDVSGSISKVDLCNFYSTINRFFKYGIQEIDVVQFDCVLYEKETLSKAMKRVEVKGRGGTDFQPFIDFVAEHPEYDGAIVYTDGYAFPPIVPPSLHTPLCWVMRSEEQYKEHKDTLGKLGRVCFIENP